MTCYDLGLFALAGVTPERLWLYDDGTIATDWSLDDDSIAGHARALSPELRLEWVVRGRRELEAHPEHGLGLARARFVEHEAGAARARMRRERRTG